MVRNILKSSHTFLVSVWITLNLLSLRVMADLPEATAVSDGADTTSPLQFLRDIGERGVTVGATLLSGLVVVGVGALIYSSFKESRDKNEWGRFGATFAAGVIVAVTVVVFSILAVDYATFTNDN